MVYRIVDLGNALAYLAHRVLDPGSPQNTPLHGLKNPFEIFTEPETGLAHRVEITMEYMQIGNPGKRHQIRTLRHMGYDKVKPAQLPKLQKKIEHEYQPPGKEIDALENRRDMIIPQLVCLLQERIEVSHERRSATIGVKQIRTVYHRHTLANRSLIAYMRINHFFLRSMDILRRHKKEIIDKPDKRKYYRSFSGRMSDKR
jgi:hypothetical protein